MAVIATLWCVAALLGTAILAAALHRAHAATRSVYVSCLLACLIILAFALDELVRPAASMPAATLPLGLPWIGARFRIDALTAFFLVVVNLGAAAASLFAVGYGEHEESPGRVLPFYPAFLAGMNLVLLADDAFSFLIAARIGP
jgi:formate hydrogenlyase subunit 3/multisubunit Na+/H+ antiporter MnhD subunit